jgi:hypothetical protein
MRIYRPSHVIATTEKLLFEPLGKAPIMPPGFGTPDTGQCV